MARLLAKYARRRQTMSMPQPASPETSRKPPQHFGVRLDLLTDDILRGAVAIYYEVALDKIADEASLLCSYFADDVDPIYGTEYRLGSMLNRESKLYVTPEGEDRIIGFTFYANHQTEADESPASPRYHEAVAIQDALARRIDEFLLALGVAEPLPEM